MSVNRPEIFLEFQSPVNSANTNSKDVEKQFIVNAFLDKRRKFLTELLMEKSTSDIYHTLSRLDAIKSGEYDVNWDGKVDFNDVKLMTFGMKDQVDEIKAAEEKLKLLQMEMGVNSRINTSQQGKIGDCWLLAALNSLSFNGRGRYLLSKSIKVVDDNNYLVHFPGIKRKYNISKNELNIARELKRYSSGDDDVLLMELAFEKFRKDIQSGDYVPRRRFLKTGITDEPDILNGGTFQQVLFLLTGEKAKFVRNNSSKFDKLLDDIYIFPMDYSSTISFYSPNSLENDVVVKDKNGKNVILSTKNLSHAWSIKYVDDKYITIVNPWHSAETYTITRNDAKKFAMDIEYFKHDDYSLFGKMVGLVAYTSLVASVPELFWESAKKHKIYTINKSKASELAETTAKKLVKTVAKAI